MYVFGQKSERGRGVRCRPDVRATARRCAYAVIFDLFTLNHTARRVFLAVDCAHRF